MPRSTPLLTTFNAGEWDPALYGRPDLAKYGNAARRLQNFIPLAQGPATRRPGTHHVAATKGDTVARLIPFEFSTVQAYQIEATDLAFRFYKDRARIESPPGTPVEIATPYAESALPTLKWTQSADILYLCDGAHEPRTLARHSHIDWTLAPFGAIDGPYEEQNTTSATLTPAAVTGDGVAVTAGPAKAITAAANNGAGLIRLTSANHGFTTGMRLRVTAVGGTVEANGVWTITRISKNTYDLQGSAFVNAYTAGGTASPAVFAATDIGRLLRLKNGASWGYAEIAGFVHEASVTVDVLSDFAATTANVAWRLGAWSDTLGWPVAAVFFGGRLWFARGQTVWGSRSGDFQTFAPSALDGTVADDDAVTYTLATKRVNVIRWLEAGDTLQAGTNGGVFTLQASALNEAITPANITAVPASTTAAADQPSLHIGQATLFVSRNGGRLHELVYRFDQGANGAYVAPELSILARHLSRPGLAAIVWQEQPWNVVWAVREDGLLLGLTYLREQDVVGWHRHPVAGSHVDEAGVTQPFGKVLSASVIPGTTQDELWLVVERVIAGATRRYVEYLEYEYAPRNVDDKDGCWFVDAGLAFDGRVAGAALTPGADADQAGATAVPFAASLAAFAAGDVGREIRHSFDTAQPDGTTRTTRARARIDQYISPLAVKATILVGFPVGAAIAGGLWGLTATTVSAADHLEGQAVQILADGASHPDKTVSGGAVALDRPALRVQLGLGGQARLETMNLESGAAEGAALAKPKRVVKAAVKLLETLGCKAGFDDAHLDTVPFRRAADPMDESPPLFTGDKLVEFPKGFEREARVLVIQDQPLPCTVAAIAPTMIVNDG